LGIKTYPEMNERIKDLLKTGQAMDLYALKRITELEEQVEKQQQEIERLTEENASLDGIAIQCEILQGENERLKRLAHAMYKQGRFDEHADSILKEVLK
jgi:predicted nuclease with TOPRIM domain